MSDQKRPVSTRSGSFGAVLRPAVALAACAVAVALVATVWNDAAAATGEVPMRIFLVGWAVAAVVVSAGFAFGHSVLPLAALQVTMGLVIGLAVGTTDWTDLDLARWWQMWWTAPLMLENPSVVRDSLPSGLARYSVSSYPGGSGLIQTLPSLSTD